MPGFYSRQTASSYIVLLLFFLSGFAALLYQVIWQRMLVFYTGSDTVSISLIITAFMSGLGIGYLVGGRLADQSSPARNLTYFVLAEVGILLFAVFSKRILYDWLYQSGPGFGENTFALYTVVFAVLLLPTFLMGVSLPVLSRAFRLADMGRQAQYISLLYFVNTLGAAVGALVTGVYLVRTVGYESAIGVGVAFNGLCGLGALFIGWRLRQSAGYEEDVMGKAETRPLEFGGVLTVWSAQYFVSGFAALALELIWFRMLETLIKSVSLTFSILLAIYLGSMAVGTVVGSRLCRSRSVVGRERLFLLAQAGLYLYLVLSVAVFVNGISRLTALNFLWDYFASYEPDLSLRYGLSTYVLIPLFLLFVPTFLMGVSFSVSQSLVQDRYEEVGRKVGWLQFINIVGSALGAWWVTWVGFPDLGTASLLKWIGALGLVYVGILFVRQHVSPGISMVLPLVLLVAMLAIPNNFRFWRQLNGLSDDRRFLFDENHSGLSIIKRFPEGDTQYGVVFANGLGQSTMPYRRDATHTVLGALPVLIHPNPQNVAVIGLGSAGTVHGIGGRPETKEIVCFEIMSNQAHVLAEYAAAANDSAIAAVMADPRLRMVFRDGRYTLHTRPDTYDLIEADALRPNSAFSGNLYSVEYFEMLRSKLKPGGMAVTWCPTPRVLNTFRSVFPYVIDGGGLLLMGSNQPITVDWAAVERRMNHTFTQRHYRTAGIDIQRLLEPYRARLIKQTHTTNDFGDVNTDLFPRDEYGIPAEWLAVWRKIRNKF